MSYLPELRASLVRAAAVESAKHRSAAPSQRRRRFGWLGPALAAGVTLAVVAVAIVLVGHARPAASPTARGGHSARPAAHVPPQQPNPSSAQWSLIQQARNAAAKSDPACWPYRKLPAFIQGSPGRELTSILGVLRRTATRVDALPDGLLSHGLPAGIYANSIRRVLYENDVALYIAATAGLGFRTVPARCTAEEQAALARETKGRSRSQVRADVDMQKRYLVWQHYEARHPGAICVATADFRRVGRMLGGATAGCGATPAQIEQGTAIGGGTGAGKTVLSGIVPDGVASVTIEFKRPPGVATVRVVNNGWIVVLPPKSGLPTRISLLAPGGRLIRTSSLP
jgi:hypothetical protein